MSVNKVMEKTSCPICSSTNLKDVLVRYNVPVHQNMIFTSRDEAISACRGHLLISTCLECSFVFNRTFDPSKLNYGPDYDNTQECSPYFDCYLDESASSLLAGNDIRNACIVEIGCGKGTFLKKIISDEGRGNRGYGFDPSYVGPDQDLNGRIVFIKEMFDASNMDIKADVVILRHVIEHIPQPLHLMESIKAILHKSSGARVFIETPCCEWILKNNVIWDFFYEHCSYFSMESLEALLARMGMKIVKGDHLFEGQYLWVESEIADGVEMNKYPRHVLRLVEQYSKSEERMKSAWRERIGSLAIKGKVALWGAGAKGVTFANLMDQDRKMIDCLIDINPNKQGKFVPGTGHPIVACEEALKRGVVSAVLMNPNYFKENVSLLEKLNIDIELVVN